jgi:hypothetical protein
MTNKSKLISFLYMLFGIFLYGAIKYVILSYPVLDIMTFSIDSKFVIIPATIILLVIIGILERRFIKHH